MLEMDRFVTTLSVEGEQTLDRESESSLATMKENYGNLAGSDQPPASLTLSPSVCRLIDDIVEKKDTTTWCGLPHNLLLPK